VKINIRIKKKKTPAQAKARLSVLRVAVHAAWLGFRDRCRTGTASVTAESAEPNSTAAEKVILTPKNEWGRCRTDTWSAARWENCVICYGLIGDTYCADNPDQDINLLLQKEMLMYEQESPVPA